MSSTAGILTLCFILSVNLCSTMPADTCKLRLMLKRMEQQFKELNSSLHVHESYHYDPEVIPYLVINKSLTHHQQNTTAMCGVHYMKEAIELLQTHHKHKNNIVNELKADFHQRIEHCAKLNFASCVLMTHPKLPASHFQIKKWTRNFLESSVKFIHQLIHFLEMSKKHSDH